MNVQIFCVYLNFRILHNTRVTFEWDTFHLLIFYFYILHIVSHYHKKAIDWDKSVVPPRIHLDKLFPFSQPPVAAP